MTEERDAIARIIDPEAFINAMLQDDLTPTERLYFLAQRERDKATARSKADAIIAARRTDAGEVVAWQWPRALLVRRKSDNRWHGDVSFAAEPTNDELDALHAFLNTHHKHAAPPAEPVAADAGRNRVIPICCVTGAVPGDGAACGDCDPCILGEPLVPDAVKRLISEKNNLIDRNGELEDAATADAGLVETLREAGDKAYRACNAAWAAGEPAHLVKDMLAAVEALGVACGSLGASIAALQKADALSRAARGTESSAPENGGAT